MKQLVLLYQVYLTLFILYSDVPFTNGKYIHGTNTFFNLYSKHIQFDESISFHSIVH